MDAHKPRGPMQPFSKLPNGYILPAGRLTPNTIFVGGLDLKMEKHEIEEFFSKYGMVKDVKIITYRGGICKGYGFIYFNEDVNIQSLIQEQITFKGRKLKLGPAIMKERGPRLNCGTMPSVMSGPGPWTSPAQYLYCTCCSPAGGSVGPPSPFPSGASPYNQQPYSYSNYGGGGLMVPQVSMNYPHNVFTYPYSPGHWADQRTQPVNQNFVDCGVQTMLTVL